MAMVAMRATERNSKSWEARSTAIRRGSDSLRSLSRAEREAVVGLEVKKRDTSASATATRSTSVWAGAATCTQGAEGCIGASESDAVARDRRTIFPSDEMTSTLSCVTVSGVESVYVDSIRSGPARVRQEAINGRPIVAGKWPGARSRIVVSRLRRANNSRSRSR